MCCKLLDSRSWSSGPTLLLLSNELQVKPERLLDGETDPEWKSLKREQKIFWFASWSGPSGHSQVCWGGICRRDHPEYRLTPCGNILHTFCNPENIINMIVNVETESPLTSADRRESRSRVSINRQSRETILTTDQEETEKWRKIV